MARSLTITLDEEDWHQVIAVLEAVACLDPRDDGSESPESAYTYNLSDEIEQQLPFDPRETILNPLIKQYQEMISTTLHTFYRRTKDGFVLKDDK